MAKNDIGKKVIINPAWLKEYDCFVGDFRGKEGEIIGFRSYSDMMGCPDETPDDDGVYFVETEIRHELHLRRFDFKFADD